MNTLLLRWLVNALALVAVSQIIPGFQVDTVLAALVAALLLGLVNATVRPLLLLLTLPITVLSLGLFSFVINALMLLLVAGIVKGFTISGFGAALAGAVLLWLVSLAANYFLKPKATLVKPGKLG